MMTSCAGGGRIREAKIKCNLLSMSQLGSAKQPNSSCVSGLVYGVLLSGCMIIPEVSLAIGEHAAGTAACVPSSSEPRTQSLC